jgi:hypothetical protein
VIEIKLSDDMIRYWTKFAVSVRALEQAVVPDWPEYYPEDDTNLVLDLKLHENQHYRQTQCDFWDSVL